MSACLAITMVSLLSVTSARVAPGDEDTLCTETLPAIDSGIPPTAGVLMDSNHYIRLLSADGSGLTSAWQHLDLDSNNVPGRRNSWIQTTNLPCQQTVSVCGFAEGPQNNWLITQYISRRVNDVLLPQVSIKLMFGQTKCTDLSCGQSFEILKRETNDTQARRETDDYRLISRVTTDTSGMTMRNVTIKVFFNSDAEGFYVAIRDEATCIEVQRLIVFYRTVCPGGPGDLVIRPEIRIDDASQRPVVLAVCVEGASPISGNEARLYCIQGGVWSTIPGSGCQCNPGFSASADKRSCIALCRAGEYYSMMFAECSVCPANSVGNESGLTVCPCAEGYYRDEGEEDQTCTPTPSSMMVPLISTTEQDTFSTESDDITTNVIPDDDNIIRSAASAGSVAAAAGSIFTVLLLLAMAGIIASAIFYWRVKKWREQIKHQCGLK